MAYIKKRNARKELERDIPMPSVSNMGTEGLRFNMTIGDHKVSLTELERDTIVMRWAAMQTEFEQ